MTTVLLGNVLAAGSSLRNHISLGIGALTGADRQLIAQTERPKVGDSLDFDDATRPEFPEANRWDYLLSVPGYCKIIGMEPHSAKDSEISVVIGKRRHAIEYLRNHLPARYRVSQWFWVTHGRVGFSKMERARRLLDQNGIEFVGRVLKSVG